MTRALLNFCCLDVSLTANLRDDQIWQKNHAGTLLESRWRNDPQVTQLFCSARTIMARALLNCGCLAVSRTANLRDDNNSPIFLLG